MLPTTHTPTFYYPSSYGRIQYGSALWRELEASPRWVLEKKYNEIRCQVHLNGDDLIGAYNRHGEALSHAITDEMVAHLGSQERGYCVYDCGLRTHKVKGFNGGLLLYDQLVWRGRPLTGIKRMDRVIYWPCVWWDAPANNGPLAVSSPFPHFANWDQVIAGLRDDPEAEGVVLKNVDGKLRLSRASSQKTNDILKWRF